MKMAKPTKKADTFLERFTVHRKGMFGGAVDYEVINIGRGGRISFNQKCWATYSISKYKTVNILYDGVTNEVALQLFKNKKGEYNIRKSKDYDSGYVGMGKSFLRKTLRIDPDEYEDFPIGSTIDDSMLASGILVIKLHLSTVEVAPVVTE
jgi:hypothetical protein